MGIRFSCSNGHKLNVKAELAGRKGFCPQCGVSVQIPRENGQAEPQEIPSFPEIPETKPSGSAVLSDPNAVWYIQVPHGPQYGPATGAVVENWIKERRISPEMLVWKEGWGQWLTAKNAFPNITMTELTQQFSNPFSGVNLPEAAINESAIQEISGISLTPQVRGIMKKKKKLSRNTVILTVLIGLIVLFGGLLVWILNR